MIPTENQEAEALARWLKCKWYIFTHIANESWLPPKVAMLSAMRKKRMWLSPWFPDFCIILKCKSLLFIELKRAIDYSKSEKGRKLSVTSKEQLEWQKELNKVKNIQCEICYWAKEAINLIENLDNN